MCDTRREKVPDIAARGDYSERYVRKIEAVAEKHLG